MRAPIAGLMHRRRNNADDGFSLIELIVAVVIIGGVLLSLVALQTRAMVSIAQSKERKQATAIANELLEEMRALPWKTITRGPANGAYATAPYVSGGQLSIPGEPVLNEPLIERSGAFDPGDPALGSPLDGIGGSNHTVHADPALPGFEFDAYSYVTQPGGAGNPYNLTVLVEWEARGRGEARHVLARTTAFNTRSGCGSESTRPYATACQDFFVAEASATAPGFTISGAPVDDGSGDPVGPGPFEILPGSDVAQISVSGPSVGVIVDSAQSSTVRGSASKGSISLVDTDGNVDSSSSDNISLTASNSVTTSQPQNDSSSTTGALPTRSISGGGMELIVDPGSPSAAATTNATQACSTWATDEQPCGFATSSNVSQSVTLKAGGETIPLLSVSGGQLEAQAGRFPGGTGTPSAATFCNVLAGPGCTGANAGSSSVSANFHGIATLNSFAPTSGVGRGDSLTTGNLTLGRSGTLNIDGIGNVNLNPSSSEQYAPTDVVEIFNDGGVLVEASVAFEVEPLRDTVEDSDPECRTAACSARATVEPVLANITYTVTTGSETTAFTLSVVVGEARTAASFTASPEAWDED